MTNYRRNLVPGGSYFFTVNLLNRRSSLLTDHVQLLRDAFRHTQLNHPFALDAIVVLPDHLHAIWTLPAGVSEFALRWRLIKAAFSRALLCGEHVSRSRAMKGERGIWQRRYWEHTLRDECDVARHVDYIHFNPVRHGYADEVWQWPYSSFRQMVPPGVYPQDWAGGVRGDDADFGER
jgi:putative transposase